MVLLEFTVDTRFIMFFLADYLEERFGQQCAVASELIVPKRRKSKVKKEQTCTKTKVEKARLGSYDRTGMRQACAGLKEATHTGKLSHGFCPYVGP